MPQTIPTLRPARAALIKGFSSITRIYNKSGAVEIDAGTFAIMFTNTGDKLAKVNNMVVHPGTIGSVLGDSRSLSTTVADLEYKGNVNVVFSGAGANAAVEIVTLFYV